MSSAADPSQEPPMATPIALLLPPITALPASSTRRLPPPCWTPDETSALIHAYRDKWYALRRANLRAPHWDDVAGDVHRRCPCPHVSPPKTALQCRHKIEKLRKRYRDELRRAHSIRHHRFSSSWTFFSLMDAMEKGPTTSPPVVAAAGDDDLNNTEDDYEPMRRDFNRSHVTVRGTSNSELGFQSKKMCGNLDGIRNPNPKYGYRSVKYNGMNGYDSPSPSSRFDERVRYAVKNSSNGSSSGEMDVNCRKEKRKRRRGAMEMEMEMVEAVRMVGEGLVRTEKMKMEMMRESERMRMEMELKRTQMILESQHRILEAFCSNTININQ